MIHGLWLPALFERNNTQYRISQFNFKPAFDAGVRFVVAEMNEPDMMTHNKYFPDLVQAAYDAGIPVVIGVMHIDIPKYYDLFHEWGMWEGDSPLVGDPVWQLYANAIRNKMMQGVIIRVDNTAMKDGKDLPENWFLHIWETMFSRWRKNSGSVNGRILSDRIFPMVRASIFDHYPNLASRMDDERWSSVETHIIDVIYRVDSWTEISEEITGPSPEYTFSKDWLFWKWAGTSFLTADFKYENGGDAIVSACAFHGELNNLYARFRHDLATEPEPEQPPVVEPEPDPEAEPAPITRGDLLDLADRINELQNGLEAIFDLLEAIATREV